MSNDSESLPWNSLSRPSPRQWLGAGLVSGLLVAGVVAYVGADRLVALLRRMDPTPLAISVIAYAGVLTTRWLRLEGLLVERLGDLRGRPSFLWTTAGHSFANQLMPFRSGELAFPVLLQQAEGTNLTEGTLFLAALRFVELGCLIPIYGVGAIVWLSRRSTPDGYEWVSYVAIAGAILLLVSLPWLLRFGVYVAETLLEYLPLPEWNWFETLRTELDEADVALEQMGGRGMAWLIAMSSLMWILMFVVFHGTLAAFEAGTGWAQTIVGSGGGLIGNLVPSGIGSLGTMEAGWIASFQATGAPKEPVLAAALVLHAIVIAGTGLATFVGLWLDTSQTMER